RKVVEATNVNVNFNYVSHQQGATLAPSHYDEPHATDEYDSKIGNIVQELIENEKTYIDKLTIGIKNYVEPLSGNDLPRSLRGQMYNIFANIVQIRDFHESKFYPSLLSCNGDVVALSDTFSMFIQNGYFYSYVLYAMNKKRSERLRDIPANKTFFIERQNEKEDKLGVNSFLMEPIQRLPKYRLLIDQLAKVLSPFLEIEKTRLAACSRAEKNVQRLLNTVNESISLNDIMDCNEINLFHQGKFLRQNEFDVYDQETRRRYRGKIFLFERSIVIAEKLDEKVLHYRGNYPKDVTGIREYDEGKKFELFIGKSGNRQIEISSTEFQLIQAWVNLVKDMLVKSIEQEKRKIAKKTHDIRIKNSLRATDVIVRKSGANYGSASVSGGSWTGSSSSSGVSSKSVSLASSAYASGVSGISNFSNVSGYSTASGDSDSTRTTWYTSMEDVQPDNNTQKTTENLLTYEKHYIYLLSQFVKTDLAELSDDIKFQIQEYL
ncbi:Pleckstrin likey domain-containing family G member 4B, partial [Pseudolycoriella hygida]